MENNIKVSVIMPVYNVKNYLEESLDSALGQTLRDIEIICVDDGSADGSSEILDRYASLDNRITVIHKENTGYGNSMNVGLDHARGKYVAILEPDDFIASDMYRDLYTLAEEHGLDIVKSDFFLLEGERGHYCLMPVKIWWQEALYEKVLAEREKRLLFQGWIAHWTALYNRAFLKENKIRYHETPGASYQDTGFWFQTLMCAERVLLHGKGYYRYRQDNPGSSMKNKAKVYCITEEYDFVFEKMKERGCVEQYLPQYIVCRYAGHRDTANRIAREFRQEFLRRASADFGRYRAEGLLDLSSMEERDRTGLELLLENPDGYYEKLTLAEELIHDGVKDREGFYIYGAGARGKKIFARISEEDREKFLGFIITKRAENERQLYGRPIYELQELEIGVNTAVIVGVTERYRQEIEDNLAERGVCSILSIPEDVI